MKKVTDLGGAIQAIEHGLLKPTGKSGQPAKKMELSKRMAYHKVPGISIALVDQGELAWARGYGQMDAGTGGGVTPETIFQAASISKPVSAMIALRLVEDGLLDLDADANDCLRSWKVPESKYTKVGPDGVRPKVTLRGLLSHNAGLSGRGYRGYPCGRQLPTLRQILNGEPPANSRPVHVIQAPGKAFKYSGGGYIVVQQMIEDVTGRSLADLAQELIFDRLGMISSTFHHLLPETFLPKTATAHNRSGMQVPGKWHIYPENASASLWTTPSDLARLIVEVIKSYHDASGLVLSAEMTRQMLTPQVNIAGLGFFIIQAGGRTRFEHPGWNEGFHSLVIGDLTSGQGLAWMTNGENGKNLGWEITRGVAKAFGWSW
ncbi:MAG: serine hydrolase domain-containing protein [Acidobacteriaceae bacterium]